MSHQIVTRRRRRGALRPSQAALLRWAWWLGGGALVGLVAAITFQLAVERKRVSADEEVLLQLRDARDIAQRTTADLRIKQERSSADLAAAKAEYSAASTAEAAARKEHDEAFARRDTTVRAESETAVKKLGPLLWRWLLQREVSSASTP